MKPFPLAIALWMMAATALAGELRYGAAPADLDDHLARLKAAYPEVIKDYDRSQLVLSSGVTIPVSDGRTDKSFDELLDSPDIDDMFAYDYPEGEDPKAPDVNVDPGRVRVESLFRVIYGDCRIGEVEPRMRKIAWFGGSVMITTRSGVDRALEAVAADLEKLPASMKKYLAPSAGTYNCRAIAGTGRMSMHAYGASIDLNTKYANYWRWQKPGKDGRLVWANQLPKAIIDVFERHGFIWGGRWYHYDTMHFEYRPELLSHG